MRLKLDEEREGDRTKVPHTLNLRPRGICGQLKTGTERQDLPWRLAQRRGQVCMVMWESAEDEPTRASHDSFA